MQCRLHLLHVQVGASPLPRKLTALFYQGVCSSYYHYNTMYVSDCLGAYFWFRALCDRNVCIVQYNIPPSKSKFIPPWKEFLIESCHVTHLLILNLIVLLSAEPVLRHDT